MVLQNDVPLHLLAARVPPPSLRLDGHLRSWVALVPPSGAVPAVAIVTPAKTGEVDGWLVGCGDLYDGFTFVPRCCLGLSAEMIVWPFAHFIEAV